ncbi:MAG TPA: FtsW/RodA/SpoVE family cell cycle protein [Chloroflexia bacterium]|nr:FtsW/RodA/SpoVE family cell cycle protein [Chloroflexia bacterium]
MRKNLRLTEFQLLIIPALLSVAGMLMVILVPRKQINWEARDLWMTFVFIGLLIITHTILTFALPRSDQLMLPLVSTLTAFGLIMAHRLESGRTGNIASKQVLWIALGYAIFIGTVLFLRNPMILKRYKYTFLIVGLVLTAAAAVFGQEVNGARLWFNFGFFSFQPGELLKLCLVIFLAGYLDDKRDLLQTPFKVLGIPLPPLPYLLPLISMWAISVLLLVFQKDLGPAELFFGVFLIMLYIASGRATYVIIGLLAFGLASVVSYQLFDHVQTRVSAWLNPWPEGQGRSFQIVQALFSFAQGGVFGKGLGNGAPYYIPEVQTDYVFAAIGEELGLAGTLAIIGLNMLLVYRCFHIALTARNGFYQYLAIGLASLVGLQSFIIIGGVTKLIPLTGMTLPFVSYGGSSILINFLIMGILVRISAEPART